MIPVLQPPQPPPAVAVASRAATRRRARPSLALLATLCSLALAGCGRRQAFPPDGDRAAFVDACVLDADAVSRWARVEPSLAAGVFSMFAVSPVVDPVKRRFEPSRPLPVAGGRLMSTLDAASLCGEAEPLRSRLAGASASEAFTGGVSHWLAALLDQSRDALEMQRTIKDAMAGKRSTQGRVAELVGRFAPRGTEFKSFRKGARLVPSVVIEAVNPLDLPIEAFFFALDLKRPNGSILASGRFTFKPPAPLAPGVTSTYLISLDGIGGFDAPEIADVRDKVTVTVRTEDVVSGGARLLADTIVDPEDARRLDALGVLRGRIEEIRDFVRRIRERTS